MVDMAADLDRQVNALTISLLNSVGVICNSLTRTATSNLKFLGCFHFES